MYARRAEFKTILDASELLRVDSIHKSMSPTKRKVLIYLVSLFYILGLIFAKQTDFDILGGFLGQGFTLSILYALSLISIMWIHQTRGKPLIITERGVVFYPIVAEKWEEIEYYSWQKMKRDWSNVFLSEEGVCLKLINEGIFQRSLDSRSGNSIFAKYLIFFSPQQIALADQIFRQHGLKRLN